MDYIERHPAERRALEPVLEDLLEEPKKIFNRDRSVHITSSMMILDYTLRTALVVEHSFHRGLLVPGGHVDGISTLDSAMREAAQEVSITRIKPLMGRPIQIDHHEIAANPEKGEGPHSHLDFMHIGSTDKPLAIADGREIISTRWMPLCDLADRPGRLGAAATRALNITHG